MDRAARAQRRDLAGDAEVDLWMKDNVSAWVSDAVRQRIQAVLRR